MSFPLLSILIPATPDRFYDVCDLLQILSTQAGVPWDILYPENNGTVNKLISDDGHCEVIVYWDNRELTIGEKREKLYQMALGRYSWQIDSDDSISDDAISEIMEAIKENPDCITFQESCAMNGEYYSSNHSLKYDDWADNFDGYNFVRTPFYKDVIKTEIARTVPFEHIRYSEDHAWARVLKPHLKTEVHIDKEIYYYIHNSKPEDHNTRYGFDRE